MIVMGKFFFFFFFFHFFFFLLFSFVPSVGNGPTCYSYNHIYSYDNDGEFCLFVYVLMLE